jgi:phosphoribosyl-AMP cyclohydrolase / phosphoribosyl-ATP pyrophosphohydrolase
MLSGVDFTKLGGLVTVVTQDARTGAVLMVAHADREALERTIATGEMHYHSRSRGLWHKGATSGNVQRLVSLTADCDGDTVLARVISEGPACHTGARTCFGDSDSQDPTRNVLDRLDAVIAERSITAGETGASYTRRLLADRNLRLKKLGEECAELITACADGDREGAIGEGADLIYHALVALRGVGVSLQDVSVELARRENSVDLSRPSGPG